MVTPNAEAALASIDKEDHGIWELRSGPRQILHTKAMLWVALDRAERGGARVAGITPAQRDRWRTAADALRATYESCGWNERLQSYTQAYESDVMDAAVLRAVLFGVFDASSPRIRSAVKAVERYLGAGDLVYRYREPDGFEGDEATFTACAFWKVGCLALRGDLDEAKAAFERLLARANDVGLYAEEIDAASRTRPRIGQKRAMRPTPATSRRPPAARPRFIGWGSKPIHP